MFRRLRRTLAALVSPDDPAPVASVDPPAELDPVEAPPPPADAEDDDPNLITISLDNVKEGMLELGDDGRPRLKASAAKFLGVDNGHH